MSRPRLPTNLLELYREPCNVKAFALYAQVEGRRGFCLVSIGDSQKVGREAVTLDHVGCTMRVVRCDLRRGVPSTISPGRPTSRRLLHKVLCAAYRAEATERTPPADVWMLGQLGLRQLRIIDGWDDSIYGAWRRANNQAEQLKRVIQAPITIKPKGVNRCHIQ